MKSPTKLSLDYLRKEGYTVAVTEHWLSFAKIRKDLFGIIDIVAIKPGVPGVFGIQTTSKSNISARIKKAMANKNLLVWYKAGNNFEIWGWGKKNGKWELDRRDIVAKRFLPLVPMR